MLHFLYSLLFRLALPFVLLRLWWRGRYFPSVRARWYERLGFVRRSREPVIWVHAVSVGETIAAAPLVRALLHRYPENPVLVTAMTATGAERARALFGNRVRYAFSPYDTPGAVRRFIERIRPRALVIMETEIWPNLITLSHARRVPVFLINARLSERSARGYARIGSLVRPVLGGISWIAAQDHDDARHFLRIGADRASVSVTGSIKFDVEITAAMRTEAERLRGTLGANRPVWIAASTHAGEDEEVLAAHRSLLAARPDALLIIVPRHPERFSSVAALTGQMGFTLARRSSGQPATDAQVYLGDTMGELAMLFGASDCGFVGGSLVPRGGHNPLEPAAWGLPVMVGPSVYNFASIYRQLAAADALCRVEHAAGIADCVLKLIRNPQRRSALGQHALSVVEANRGVLATIVDGIAQRI